MLISQRRHRSAHLQGQRRPSSRAARPNSSFQAAPAGVLPPFLSIFRGGHRTSSSVVRWRDFRAPTMSQRRSERRPSSNAPPRLIFDGFSKPDWAIRSPACLRRSLSASIAAMWQRARWAPFRALSETLRLKQNKTQTRLLRWRIRKSVTPICKVLMEKNIVRSASPNLWICNEPLGMEEIFVVGTKMGTAAKQLHSNRL